MDVLSVGEILGLHFGDYKINEIALVYVNWGCECIVVVLYGCVFWLSSGI